jgi:hypothetical protein
MARPLKSGLDYFPLDVTLDEKVELLEAKHGIVGFGILIKLFQKIYKHGYYIKWSEDALLLFKKQVNVDINTISAVIIDCYKWEIFNKELFEKYQILTSRGIQRRYITAVGRRTKIEIIRDIAMIDESFENYSKIVYVDNNDVNVDINTESKELMSAKSTQSKVKESKVKESKGKESKGKESDAESPRISGFTNSKAEKLFLQYWQHNPDIFNYLSRIESPKEWENFWNNSGTTCDHVKTAMDNFIADVKSGNIERKYIPSMPDRFVLKGWITKCQERLLKDKTAPPPNLSDKKSLGGLKSW